ncbi:MAG: lysylphosphatidylglycerol synthase transmembrane domain-containing protein [Acidimicrobiales bacterium]
MNHATRRRLWTWGKFVVGLALGALAVWAVAGRRSELSGASTYLARLNWAWLVVAGSAEALSLVCFALVQQRLLAAARVHTSVGQMSGVTVASTAIANSMPAGPVVSGVFAFNQYRRRGADDAVSLWTLGAVFVCASVTLALIAVAGLAIAGDAGTGYDLVGVTVAVLVATLGVGVVFVNSDSLAFVVRSALRLSHRVVRWPRGDDDSARRAVERIVDQATAVRLGWRDIVGVATWGMSNWLLDCTCLAVCFVAVGVHIPWRGLLLAYGAGQLAANLPVTPGGLGVVEGSLTIALVAYGGAETSTVAAVLLYRILSFWLELPLGWLTWGYIVLATRRERQQASLATLDRRVDGVPA